MTIYYLCPERTNPVGGVQVIYRHVDILNKHGIPAFVVHKETGFRSNWFENDTPIVYWRNNPFDRLQRKVKRRLTKNGDVGLPITGGPASRISSSDILVVPEVYGPDFGATIAPGVKKVVLNQNCYLTFKGYSFTKDRINTPYNHKDVIATLINSDDGEAYLRYVFPELPLHKFRLSIDPQRFYFQREKKRQICFSRIKNERDARQVVNILKFRGVLKDFEIVPFINVPQKELAGVYRDSLLFLSFGYPEGFGLPAAEAMASGCVVIGFHGGGGREFFDPEFSYPIEQGNILGFVRTIEEVITQYDRDPIAVLEKGRKAADFIRETYSPELEEQDVVRCWNAILEHHTRT